jgi:hypothetical protein
LELANGIPSHDTFRRIFQAVCPQALQHGLDPPQPVARRVRLEPLAAATL